MDEKKTAASNWVVHTAHSAFWFLGKSAQIHYCDKRLKLWLTLIHTHTPTKSIAETAATQAALNNDVQTNSILIVCERKQP